MSHFTCLVIADDHEAALQPFHEFECTGTNDQYVQNIDETAERREEYEADTERTIIAPDGTQHYLYTLAGEYDERFAQEGEHGRKKKFVPEGWTEGETPAKARSTFVEWLARQQIKLLDPRIGADEGHKYSFYTIGADGEVATVIRRTNPEKKWDWWTVGGRWSGFLKLKQGAQGVTGQRGLMGSHFASGQDRVDQAKKSDIDFDGMRAQAIEKASERWSRCRAIVGMGDAPWQSWESIRTGAESIQAARDQYNGQSAVVALKEADPTEYGWELDDKLALPLDTYLQLASDKALCTFAVLLDGKWYERGEMGWWACVNNEKATGEWEKEFATLLDALPDDALLTVVDCHI